MPKNEEVSHTFLRIELRISLLKQLQNHVQEYLNQTHSLTPLTYVAFLFTVQNPGESCDFNHRQTLGIPATSVAGAGHRPGDGPAINVQKMCPVKRKRIRNSRNKFCLHYLQIMNSRQFCDNFAVGCPLICRVNSAVRSLVFDPLPVCRQSRQLLHKKTITIKKYTEANLNRSLYFYDFKDV